MLSILHIIYASTNGVNTGKLDFLSKESGIRIRWNGENMEEDIELWKDKYTV